MLVKKVKAKTDRRLLREPIDRKKWFMSPTTIDALYSPSTNTMSTNTCFLNNTE
jgi:predicted metalloendopeptidase